MIDIEKSSFNPLVFTKSRGMAPNARVYKRLAAKIAEKRWEPYASAMTYIKDKAQIFLFKEHPFAVIQGFQSNQSDVDLQNLTNIDFSLIPKPTIRWMLDKIEQEAHQFTEWKMVVRRKRWCLHVRQYWARSLSIYWMKSCSQKKRWCHKTGNSPDAKFKTVEIFVSRFKPDTVETA